MISNYFKLRYSFIKNEMLIEQSKSISYLNHFMIEELKSLKFKVDYIERKIKLLSNYKIM
ncbi:hypothetical protein [Mammaliicoccus fleurettii]|uniref:hypothetical protein n=1 Tax=Mammaliicoccus fleurettii TaxID=150056 RepID=UPI001AADEBDC|nr:hypothetical protein [Mammaliicoccus fleurettii]MBO3062927.1 hypothetical protein [Mammaliicoccus fleurettii]